MRYFLSVAKHRSFTKAAAELFVVQPALSQQIKRLERELGVELIDRRGGQVTLTLAGITFKRRAEVILADVNIALSEMRGFSEATTGRVAFGAMYTLNGGAVDFPELFSGGSAQNTPRYSFVSAKEIPRSSSDCCATANSTSLCLTSSL